ncbi:MAG: class I mannose-6-phosphate isomerase [Oscillospiraceae bacterium]|nr:class I mannose-6-phosphate isomerase [Oscillospiraceae bacterium]
MKNVPMKLIPAYRFGKDTPWGGDNLRRLYGKDTPSDRTGESLEASILAGLESRAEDGTTLAQIIPDFPLLIKLIDARERLSVQVHPNDKFARAAEGKLGKTEAWVVLHAEEGASIVYGLAEGRTADDLARALSRNDEADVMSCLNVAQVKEGDVFYIDAGTVHALGAGVIVYEIQQNSDVTYRLYDYGRPRELHLEKGLACVREKQYNESSDRIPNKLPLNTPFFSLERMKTGGDTRIEPADGFRVLTTLGEGRLVCGDTEIPFGKLESFFVPARCAEFRVITDGDVLVAGE